MGLELIYTSARKGLKPGSVGFCTVAMSRQMSSALAATLESLSGYRHLYTAGNGDYADNPVNFCHYLLADRGRVARVIARIGAAPADYTGRTNKLAHFMVLDSAELPLAGPAWLLQRPGLLPEVWQGEPRWIESPAAIPNGDSVPARCAAWQRVTGDAGWAGELLRRFCDQPEAPVHIVCKPGTPTLELFAEALALLPAAVRWQIAFSTYFTGIQVAGVKCHWRGIVAGTAMAEGALDAKSVMDLTRLPGRAPDGPCNVAARDGTMIDLSVLRSSVIKVEAPITLATPPELPGRKAGGGRPAATGLLELAPLTPERKATRFIHPHNVDQAADGRHAPRRRRWILPVILGVVAFVILAMVGTAFLARHLGSARQLQQAMVAVGISGHGKPVASSVPTKKKPVTSKKQATPALKKTHSASKKSGNGKKTPGKNKQLATHGKANLGGTRPRSGKQTPATTNHASVHRPLQVVDQPIFAKPASGLLQVGPHAPTTATVNDIASFRVRFPPPAKAGRLIIGGTPGVVADKWCRVGTLPASGAAIDVRWKPNAEAGAGGLGLDSVKSDTLARLNVTKAGKLTVRPGSRPSGPELTYVEQMVVDVRLKNGRLERMQFLPSGGSSKHPNQPRMIHLNSTTAAAVGIASSLGASPGICLVMESLRPSGFGLQPPSGKRNTSPSVFSSSLGPRAITNKKPRMLRFSIAGGQAHNNFQALFSELKTRLTYWRGKVVSCGKVVKSDETGVKQEEKSLKDQGLSRKKMKENKYLKGLNSNLTQARNEQATAQSGDGSVAAQMKKLEALESVTFRVGLYPGGPVLERFTFERGPGK